MARRANEHKSELARRRNATKNAKKVKSQYRGKQTFVIHSAAQKELKPEKKSHPKSPIERSTDKQLRELRQREAEISEREEALEAYLAEQRGEVDPELQPGTTKGVLVAWIRKPTTLVEFVTIPGKAGLYRREKKRGSG